jgi:hypothetical protein
MWLDPLHYLPGTVHHAGNLRANFVLPPVASMHCFMQASQLVLILKLSYLYIDVALFLAHEACDYHHAHGDLKGNDHLPHEVYPLLSFLRPCPVLSQLKKQFDLLRYAIGV